MAGSIDIFELMLLHLYAQLNEDEDYEPAELWKLGPRDLSFWIASNFRENPQHQQVLLQVTGSPRPHFASRPTTWPRRLLEC